MKKKLSLMLVTALMLCSVITGCSNSKETEPTATTPPNPGHVSSLPEDAIVVDINELCSGAGEANAAGWIPTNIYIDTVQKQYDQTQDENLRLVLEYAETPISSAHIFLGMKFSENTVTYAYEATELNTDNIMVVYVEIASSGNTNTTTGPVSDEDMILLGVDEELPTEDASVSENDIVDEKESKVDKENTSKTDAAKYKNPVGKVTDTIDTKEQ